MDKLLAIISEIALPSAYDHFAEGEVPPLPYLLYLIPANNNFAADNRAYFKVNEVHIELYTDRKDPAAEQQVEAVLDRHSIFYEKSEVWIESEKLYEVLFIFDMEVNENA